MTRVDEAFELAEHIEEAVERIQEMLSWFIKSWEEETSLLARRIEEIKNVLWEAKIGETAD